MPFGKPVGEERAGVVDEKTRRLVGGVVTAPVVGVPGHDVGMVAVRLDTTTTTAVRIHSNGETFLPAGTPSWPIQAVSRCRTQPGT